MKQGKRTVQIRVQPWFRDHCFDGKPVLAAVESLLLLAREARTAYPGLNIQAMEDGRFPRFLAIPAAVESLEVRVELEQIADGTVRAGLFSRQQTGRFARLLEHASVVFGRAGNLEGAVQGVKPSAAQQPFTVSGRRLYAELVPFGPAYRNLIEVDLFPLNATARLQTPQLAQQPAQDALGSPFLLDSALHAACAWGQRFAGFVPFPVGFKSRRVLVPALPGGQYRVEAAVVVGRGRELEFDLDLVDSAGRPVEQLQGVRMRDVGGGRIKVPDWVRLARA